MKNVFQLNYITKFLKRVVAKRYIQCIQNNEISTIYFQMKRYYFNDV